MMGDETAITQLLESGADPFKKNVEGETPLATAREHTYSNVSKVFELLEEAEMESLNKPYAGDGK